MDGAASFDVIVVGAGSAGCAAAAQLAQAGVGTVAVVEAGPTDSHPLVKMPLGLIWLMGSKRDWRFQSAPMKGLNGRQIKIPRGRMVGGSGSINSMVWFRGRADDFDNWHVPGWAWSDVEPAFESVEQALRPTTLADPHPLTRALGRLFGANDDGGPTPERESAGVCRFNLHDGRRWSAADAFLRDAPGVTILTGKQVQRISMTDRVANGVVFEDGETVQAHKGVMLSAGSIGSPSILLQSGIGPAQDLTDAGIDVTYDAPQIGANLHDHPGIGLHHAGPGSGYGLSLRQAGRWLLAPFRYLVQRRGVLCSPTVEGSMFFATDGGDTPDVQSHFIPFFMNWRGSRFVPGEGYFADVCVCRPVSRGKLAMTRDGISIDLGVLSDERDLETMVAGVKRLRRLLADAPFDDHRAPEAYPAGAAMTDDDLRSYIRDHAGTAYHPVGTLRMGQGDAPVTPNLQLRGIEKLWVADASIMPQVTSANTNAPSMMIGYRGGKMMAQALV